MCEKETVCEHLSPHGFQQHINIYLCVHLLYMASSVLVFWTCSELSLTTTRNWKQTKKKKKKKDFLNAVSAIWNAAHSQRQLENRIKHRVQYSILIVGGGYAFYLLVGQARLFCVCFVWDVPVLAAPGHLTVSRVCVLHLLIHPKNVLLQIHVGGLSSDAGKACFTQITKVRGRDWGDWSRWEPASLKNVGEEKTNTPSRFRINSKSNSQSCVCEWVNLENI